MKSPKKTRRRFSKEFKLEAIRQLELRGSRPVKEVAGALGVAENMLHAWRRELGDEAEAVMAERGESKDQELQRLRRENQQLKQDSDTLKKINRLVLEGKVMSPLEVIDKFKATISVRRLCDSLGVSPSSYYAWRKYEPSKRDLADAQMAAKVRAIYHEHRGRYGSPRVFNELKSRGEKVSRKRIERLMRQEGICGTFRRRFRRTTNSQHKHPVAPNLLERHFEVDTPNRVWVGDITYVWTNEGWSYLAVLIDLYSRKVIGWALSKRLTRDLALQALRKALVTRQPPPGLIHHTDRGCQYASHEYRQVLAAAGIQQSMSRVGDCWDNAVSESFFASIKKELIHRETYATRTEAYDAIGDYIDNYFNARRRHSTIGYAIPNQFEQEATQLAA